MQGDPHRTVSSSYKFPPEVGKEQLPPEVGQEQLPPEVGQQQFNGARPGDLFAGRYRIDELLGQGGYGRVYRATQISTGRAVALKAFATGYEDGAGRFAREAAVIQRLEHPNTVRLFDHGLDERGRPYLVLELLRGRPLDRLLTEGGPLPLDAALRVTAQVLKSLMEAHAMGVIHRDIKPANVFITSRPGEPMFAKVLDFGLAKDFGAGTRAGHTLEQAMAAKLTGTGEVLGTANYMAPEQVSGGVLTPQTDVYAVGLLLGEALSGAPLVRGSSTLAVAQLQASAEPVPIPANVEATRAGRIVRRAVEKRVDLRYASAREMLADLELVLAGGAPARPRTSRALIVLVALGALLVGVAIMLSVALMFGEEPNDSDRREDLSRISSARASTTEEEPTVESPATPESFDVEKLKSSLVASGYRVFDPMATESPGVSVVTLRVEKGPCKGTVTRFVHAAHGKRRMVGGQGAQPGTKLLVEGRTSLLVSLTADGASAPSAACTDPAVAAMLK